MNAGTAKLVVLSGKLKGKSVPVTKSLIIGRQPGVNVRLNDNRISREHSKVYRQGADYYIVDLNSRNGTLVNDAKITKRLLAHGDEIKLGETTFRFELPAPEPEKTPAKVVAPKEVYREVEDLTVKPPPRRLAEDPAGAIRADEIVVKDRALQFSKTASSRKKPSALFGDLGQRPALYQALMALVVLGISVVFLLIGLYLGGVIGG